MGEMWIVGGLWYPMDCDSEVDVVEVDPRQVEGEMSERSMNLNRHHHEVQIDLVRPVSCPSV